MPSLTRRQILRRSSLLAAALTLPGLAAQSAAPARKLKVVVVGGHPDDPETGCGGTIALYSDAGHDVTIVYLTRGEAGIKGATHEQAAAIRSAEAIKACTILNARPVFAGQIDGASEVTPARYDEFRTLLESEHPDIVFTHWPLDTHRDHRAAYNLVFDAWRTGGRLFDLYYFEVDQGRQTHLFNPTDYVDIAATLDRKKAACFAHISQKPATDFWPLHEQMDRFRGIECGVRDAEGFIRESYNREHSIPLRQPPAPAI